MRDIARLFQALSDVNRIRILKMLEVRPLCVCEIREILGLATSTVSKHLSILRENNFIIDEKDGRWVNYQINNAPGSPVSELMPLLKKWLPDEQIIQSDRKQVEKVDRNMICGV